MDQLAKALEFFFPPLRKQGAPAPAAWPNRNHPPPLKKPTGEKGTLDRATDASAALHAPDSAQPVMATATFTLMKFTDVTCNAGGRLIAGNGLVVKITGGICVVCIMLICQATGLVCIALLLADGQIHSSRVSICCNPEAVSIVENVSPC